MFSKHFTALATLAVLLPSIIALPAGFEALSDPLTSRSLAHKNPKAIFARGLITGRLPTCSDDPSYNDVQSRWKDGQGVYLGSDCNTGSGQWHCWTDYFDVGSQGRYDSWNPTGNEIDCATTQSCNDVKANLAQTCNTIGWSVSTTISAEFLGAGTSVTAELNGNQQVCAAATDSSTCTWADQGCHSIWAATKTIARFGYAKRVCNTGRDGVNIASPQIAGADGYYTVGMLDYTYDTPSSQVVIGCAAACADTSYPHDLPASDSAIHFS